MRLILINIIIATILISCNNDSFLTQPSDEYILADSFLINQKQAIAAINATYSPLQSQALYGGHYFISYGTLGDDVISNELRYYNFEIKPSDNFVLEIWSMCYTGIGRANYILQNINKIKASKIDSKVKNRIIAEASFLRALYYWHLVTIYGEVPLITNYNPNYNQYSGAKSSKDSIWNQMVADLKYAQANLPIKYVNSDVGRATQGAATALLGKIHLYRTQYNLAAIEFENLINNNNYSLVSNYNLLFIPDNENNSESIFEVQFNAQGGTPFTNDDTPNTSEGTMRNAYVGWVQEFGMREMYAPSKILVRALYLSDSINSKNPRYNSVIFSRNDTAYNYVLYKPELTTGKAINGYSVKKGIMPLKAYSSTGGYSNNWPIIRYADILLMYAETQIKLGNDTLAKQYINKIRERALGSEYNEAKYGIEAVMKTYKLSLFEALKRERLIELCFENHRFPDLVRWGDAQKVLGARGYSAKNEYWPIPTTEIDRSGGQLVQNPLW
jgi:hypothetical protein